MPDELKPCEKCALTGGQGQIVTRVAGEKDPAVLRGLEIDALAPCDCEYAAQKATRAAARAQQRTIGAPVLTEEAAAIYAELVMAIPYTPQTAGIKSMIGDEIQLMCRNDAEAIWLAKRMNRLFSEWPGIEALRHVYCANRYPRDGQMPVGQLPRAYPDGIPADQTLVETPLLGAGETKRIAAGSDDQDVDGRLRAVASSKGFPEPPPRETEQESRARLSGLRSGDGSK